MSMKNSTVYFVISHLQSLLRTKSTCSVALRVAFYDERTCSGLWCELLSVTIVFQSSLETR